MPSRKALKNRLDLATPKPAVTGAGQPNGKFNASQVPEGLPYGERGQLTGALKATAAATPRAPGPAMAPPPTSTDYTQGNNMQSVIDQVRGRQRQPVTQMFAPTERPNEPLTAGSMTQPDPAVQPGPPQAVSPLLQQVAMLTGSAALASLATRMQADGR